MKSLGKTNDTTWICNSNLPIYGYNCLYQRSKDLHSGCDTENMRYQHAWIKHICEFYLCNYTSRAVVYSKQNLFQFSYVILLTIILKIALIKISGSTTGAAAAAMTAYSSSMSREECFLCCYLIIR